MNRSIAEIVWLILTCLLTLGIVDGADWSRFPPMATAFAIIAFSAAWAFALTLIIGEFVSAVRR